MKRLRLPSVPVKLHRDKRAKQSVGEMKRFPMANFVVSVSLNSF